MEEPSSEYYSETPPEAGREEAAAAEPAKERPTEPEADYGGGTDDELSVVPPKEAKEPKQPKPKAMPKEPEPKASKELLAEPQVKKKPKAPEEADSRKRERSPKSVSGQSSNRSWEKVEVKGSAWDVRPGHPMEKNERGLGAVRESETFPNLRIAGPRGQGRRQRRQR